MDRQLPFRQRVRKGLIITFFILFPVILNYLSPYLIVMGASEGVINGSFIMFGLLFISSLFAGRLWCGWVCPGGGEGEILMPVQNKRVNLRRTDWIKWLIWIPWIILIVVMAINSGGYQRLSFFYMSEEVVSVTEPANYVIYFGVVGIFMILALMLGRRGGCHSICWMVPFMILGRKLRNLGGWPALRLSANQDACTSCLTCNRNCPMSLDVNSMVLTKKMEHAECILCLSCVDHCPTKAIKEHFAAGRC